MRDPDDMAILELFLEGPFLGNRPCYSCVEMQGSQSPIVFVTFESRLNILSPIDKVFKPLFG